MTPGQQLYELIGEVMRRTFGPGGRADNVTWEKMDGANAEELGYPSEKKAWEEIAERFSK